MKTSDYLDLAQKKTGKRNDNQLSELLGWSRSKVNNYRHNRQGMDNEAARQIAEILDVPVWQIIADMEAERQKDPSKKRHGQSWPNYQSKKARQPLTYCFRWLFSLLGSISIYYVKLHTPE